MNRNNIKIALGVLCAAGALTAAAAVKKPAIRPDWSGAKIATWTMDYKKALEQAKTEGRYTVMLLSGMWWCPYCQDGEKNVWSTSAWKKFAKGNGLYTVAMDYPSRTGDSRWCWLWDNDYRKKAKITAEEAAAEIVERLHVQGELGLELGSKSVRTATNYVVEVVGSGKNVTTNFTLYTEEPTTSYNELDYGNLVVFDPEGNIAGRVNISHAEYVDGKKVGVFYPEYVADPVGFVKGKLNAIMHPEAGEPLEEAAKYDGVVCEGEDAALVGTVSAKTGKPNKDTNIASVSLSFVVDGKKTTVKASVFSAENVTAKVVDKAGNETVLTLGADKIVGTFNGKPFSACRDVLGEGDADATAALEPFKGVWAFAVRGEFADATGCRSCGTYREGFSSRAYLNVNIANKGKAKVTGQTAGGGKVSVSTSVSVDGDVLLVPVVDAKSGMSFVLTLKPEVSIRCPRSGEELAAFGRPPAALSEPLYYSCEDGFMAKLTVKGKKMTGPNGLSLSYAPKTGVVKGSYVLDGAKTDVYGLFAGAAAELFAAPKGEDGYDAKISSAVPEGYVEPHDDEGCDDCLLE